MASAFQKLPRPTVEVNDHSGQAHLYEGVALSQPLTLAGIPLRHDLKGADIAKFLHAEGWDGFVVEFSLPEFDHHGCWVADTKDETSLEEALGPLQIIAPADMRRSRWVKQLRRLRIKRSQ